MVSILRVGDLERHKYPVFRLSVGGAALSSSSLLVCVLFVSHAIMGFSVVVVASFVIVVIVGTARPQITSIGNH